MDEVKDIWWEGTSKDDLLEFPVDARHLMGYQLHIVQCGDMPEDWKPLKNLGKGITGVYEIRISVDKEYLSHRLCHQVLRRSHGASLLAKEKSADITS